MNAAKWAGGPPGLVDCHSHLDGFDDAEVGRILERATAAGVGAVVTAGTTLGSSQRAVRLAEAHRCLFAAVGLHPQDLSAPLNGEAEAELIDLASSERVVAVSEIGLDFQDSSPDRAVQFGAFRRQIGMARELGLPIVFHSRGADRDALRVLREERGFEVGGAMHYFQGDDRTAREAIDLGFWVSLARPLLRLPALRSVAAGLPMDWIVLETDAYPQPFKKDRSRWTEPRHAAEIAAELARLKSMEAADVAAATTSNALRMLGRRAGALARLVRPGAPGA